MNNIATYIFQFLFLSLLALAAASKMLPVFFAVIFGTITIFGLPFIFLALAQFTGANGQAKESLFFARTCLSISWPYRLLDTIQSKQKSYKHGAGFSVPLTAMGLLALALKQLGDYKQYKKVRLESLAYQKKLGSEEQLALLQATMGQDYRNEGDFDKALQFFDDAINALTTCIKDRTASGDPFAGATNLNLANAFLGKSFIFSLRGKYAEAEDLLSKAIPLLPVLPAEFETRIPYETTLASVLAYQGKISEANSLLHNIETKNEQAKNLSHFNKLIIYSTQSKIYRLQNNLSAANSAWSNLDPLMKSMSISERYFGELYAEKGLLFLAMSKPEEAIPYFEKALKLLKATHSEFHPVLIEALVGYEKALEQLGRTSECENMSNQIKNIRMRFA